MNKEEINHLLELARLELTEKEKEKINKDLAQILKYVGQLAEISTDNVEPMNGGSLLDNRIRKDKVIPSPDSLVSELKEAAPNREGEYFKTPPIA